MSVLVVSSKDYFAQMPECQCRLGEACPWYEGWPRYFTGGLVTKCVDGQYCDNVGMDFASKSDLRPDCKVCDSGKYFSRVDGYFVLESQMVRGPDNHEISNRERDLNNAARAFGEGDLIRRPIPDFFQICQHCPINTIVNSQYEANNGPRCFYSCSDAYAKMLKTETLQDGDMKFESPKLVNTGAGLEIQDTHSNIFPGSVLDGYELKSFHSVVKLEFAIGVVDWRTTDKYHEYSRYITENMEDFYQILRLPPPHRICQECEAGKSMFFKSCNGYGYGCVQIQAELYAL